MRGDQAAARYENLPYKSFLQIFLTTIFDPLDFIRQNDGKGRRIVLENTARNNMEEELAVKILSSNYFLTRTKKSTAESKRLSNVKSARSKPVVSYDLPFQQPKSFFSHTILILETHTEAPTKT